MYSVCTSSFLIYLIGFKFLSAVFSRFVSVDIMETLYSKVKFIGFGKCIWCHELAFINLG